jgi:hypothetical protein
MHFTITNGYHIHLWLKGDSDRKFQQLPIYNLFFCSYPDSRLKVFEASNIKIIPTAFNNTDVLWMGSYMVRGTNSAKDIANLI